MKLIELHPDAFLDYDEISIYYEHESPKVLNNFIDEFERKYETISCTPEIFPVLRKKIRKCVMKKFPYNIIFREFDENIIIYAIAHQKRKPGYWSNRL